MRAFFKDLGFVLHSAGAQPLPLVFVFVAISVFDLIGLGLVGPFIGIVIRPELAEKILTQIQPFAPQIDTTNELIGFAGALLITIYLAKGICAYLMHRHILRFCFELRAKLIMHLMQKYLFLPYSFFIQRTPASLIQVITGHTKTMCDDLIVPLLKLTADSILLIAIMIFLFWLSPLALFSLILLVAIASFGYVSFIRPLVVQSGRDVTITHEQIIHRTTHGVSGIKEIRAFQAEPWLLKLMSSATDGYCNAYCKFNSLLILPRYLMEFVLVGFVVSFATYIVLSGSMNGGELMMILASYAAAAMRALPAIIQMNSSMASMSFARASFIEVVKDLRIDMEDLRDKDALHSPEAFEKFQSLEIKGIRFAYDAQIRPAIKDLDFSIQQGEFIGIIGESGSGKTTFIDLILGLHKIQGGQIVLNHAPVEETGWHQWRKRVGYIGQQPFLTEDSIEDNVAFGVGRDLVDPERLKSCLSQAQIGNLLNGDEFTKRRGSELSGGQKQRIAIARALYHQKEILILDECTSALDPDTETRLMEVVKKLTPEKTILMITHRLATIKNCDRVFKMENGSLTPFYGEGHA